MAHKTFDTAGDSIDLQQPEDEQFSLMLLEAAETGLKQVLSGEILSEEDLERMLTTPPKL